MAQKAKPAQPKSDPIIEALQRELKQQGFYPGEIDGQAGGETTEAVARRDAAAQKSKELEIELLKAQGSKGTADAEAAATQAETARKQAYTEQETSPLGMATQSAASVLAPALAGAAGLKFGDKVNQYLDSGQEKRNVTLRGAAEDRIRGLTTRKGAIEGVERSGAMPSANKFVRVGSRLAPHLALGALSMGKGAHLLSDVDDEQAFYPRMADRAAGLGYIGFGAGLAKRGIQYAAGPGVSPDAQALAVINSEGLRRNGAPGALAKALGPQTLDLEATEVRPALPAPGAPEGVEKSAPTPGSKAYLQQQAKDLGLKGITRMTKPQLADALAQAMGEHGAKRTRAPKLPKGTGAAGLAAALAYGMTPDTADAATGEPTGNRSEALTNAAAAGGIGYGVSKLADALKPVAGQALGAAGTMMTPMMAAEAYDPSSEQLAMDRNTLARALPSILRGGAVEDAYQMAQVPERNTLARALMAGR